MWKIHRLTLGLGTPHMLQLNTDNKLGTDIQLFAIQLLLAA